MREVLRGGSAEVPCTRISRWELAGEKFGGRVLLLLLLHSFTSAIRLITSFVGLSSLVDLYGDWKKDGSW